MKNTFLLLIFLAFFFHSCNDNNKGEEPIILIDSVYVNNELERDYINRKLSKYDVVDIYTTLCAPDNASLVSFITSVICGDVCPVTDIRYEENIIDSDIITEKDGTTLRFIDGINRTNVSIKTIVIGTSDEELNFKFYLSTYDAGIKEEVGFKIKE